VIIQRLFLIFLLLTPLFAGCRASYPTGSVEETIRKLCEKEYGVAVQVKAVGKTIGALIVMEDILLSDLTFSDQALNKIENVMLTTSRVTLSSEFTYDFFIVTIMDAKTGVQVSFVRYIKDIRRLIMDDISRSDYFQRLLIEVNITQPSLAHQLVTYKLKEYQLSEFLARQIAERLRTQLQMNLVIERLFHISGIQGDFLPGPRRPADGCFQLTLYFYPSAPPFTTIGTPELREDFMKLLFTTAQKVIRRYEFTNFAGMAIVDESGRQMAYYDREEFSKGSMNTLMELIRSIKEKEK